MFTWQDLKEAGDYVKKYLRASHKLVEARLAFNKFKMLNKSPLELKTQQDVADALKVISPDRVNCNISKIEARSYMGGNFYATANLRGHLFYEDLDMLLRNVFAKIWLWTIKWKRNPRMVSVIK